MLQGKKVLIGVTGSIAAYKTILLVRLLIKAGAEVKIIMTSDAKNFVSPLVLSTLTRNKIYADLSNEDEWANHVELGRWANVFLIAPLTLNTLAKMANGICDNLLLATYFSATCPVVIAPAMDEDMWRHATTKRNLNILLHANCSLINVENGELGSGLFGEGRMSEPETIFNYLIEHFFRGKQLNGCLALVSAGPTYEHIDPVRFIGNHSSGKMGYALAEELYLNGASVTIVSGPTNISTNYKGIEVINVLSAEDMYDKMVQYANNSTIILMCAAVADYKPIMQSSKKIKKAESNLTIELTKTKDILTELGKLKKREQFLVGFALETDNELENAQKKLTNKNLDAVILNSLNDKNAGFAFDTNKITIINKKKETFLYDLKSKKEVAKDIVSFIINEINE